MNGAGNTGTEELCWMGAGAVEGNCILNGNPAEDLPPGFACLVTLRERVCHRHIQQQPAGARLMGFLGFPESHKVACNMDFFEEKSTKQ
jgi:hypothetical protein